MPMTFRIVVPRGCRAALALALAMCLAPGGRAHEAGHTAGAGPAAVKSPRDELLARAEAALCGGDAGAARDLFEQAAGISHAADTELGIVRAAMQAGAYREAAGFAAHTAGAHPETGAGAALYAWLLHLAAQEDAARATLARARALLPGDATLEAAQRLLDTPDGAASGILLRAPGRLAPCSAPPAAGWRTLSSGTLIDSGRRALAPLAATGAARRLRVRDGLGRDAAARVIRVDAVTGLAELALDPPLPPHRTAASLTSRAVFPGAPIYGLEYSGSAAEPAWPRMRIGFMGGAGGTRAIHALGIAVPAGPRGGPVFDGRGNLAGIATVDAAGRDTVVLAPLLRSAHAMTSADEETARLGADEIYERALTQVVQVLGAP
jgi:hypothetical protein